MIWDVIVTQCDVASYRLRRSTPLMHLTGNFPVIG